MYQRLDAAIFFLLFSLSVGAYAENAKPISILLDPGHTPTQQGAMGVRGVYEVAYNDRFAAKLAAALRAASFTVNLSRLPQQSITLAERAAMANNGQYQLFLAIHHDSAQPMYLTPVDTSHPTIYRTVHPIAGYSIFVSKRNVQFAHSYRFAEQLGQSLHQLGRLPTLHHAENIAGEHRELLNVDLGVYRFDDLIVLAKTSIPAVLLEVGVIVDANDEQYVANEANQEKMCAAIVRAVQTYVNTRH